jgi:hypothetical protein
MSWVLRACAFPLPPIRVFALPSRYYVQEGLLFSGEARNAAWYEVGFFKERVYGYQA